MCAQALVQQALRELIELGPRALESFQHLIDITGVEPSGNYGLDSSVLIDLMVSDEANEFFSKVLSRFRGNKFSTSHYCLGETKKVLIRDYNYSISNAEQEIGYLIENLGLQFTNPVDGNRCVTRSKLWDAVGAYGLNKEDISVIEHYSARDLIIIVRDRVFVRTCDNFKIDRVNWPTFLNPGY